MVFAIFPGGSAFADLVSIGGITLDVMAVTVDGAVDIPIDNRKAVPYNSSSIEMILYGAPDLVSLNGLNGIGITANGVSNETYKFNITYSQDISAGQGNLSFSLKNSSSGSGYIQPYQLIKHALYKIHIPANTFVGQSSDIDYTFATNTDTGDYANEILDSAYPSNGLIAVSSSGGDITFKFICDIDINSPVFTDTANYVEINSVPFNADMQGYVIPASYEADSIANYSVTAGVYGNELVLHSNTGAFVDFSDYTVKLKAGAVNLNGTGPEYISNGDIYVNFFTNDIITNTYPANNMQNVSVNPTIRFDFKYPVLIWNEDGITISTDTGSLSIDRSRDIKLSDDGKTLLIDLNGFDAAGTNVLKKSTTYKVAISQSTLLFEDPYLAGGGIYNYNEDISLSFTTTGSGQGPVVTGYSSDQAKTDDITSQSNTRLDRNGSIFVHFDRDIAVNKNFSPASLINAVKLYKIPKADASGYDPQGRIFDQTVSFYPTSDADIFVPKSAPQQPDPKLIEDKTYLEQTIVSDVYMVDVDTIRITPEYPLDNFGKYKLTIDNAYIADLNGYNMEDPVEATFWTQLSASSIDANWKVGDSSTIYKPDLSGDTADTAGSGAIVLDLDNEIIVNTCDKSVVEGLKTVNRISFGALKDISLTEVNNPDNAAAQIKISEYKLEYYYDNGTKKTKLYLYPEHQLGKGKSFKLAVGAGVFTTRSGSSPGALSVNFTVNGDNLSQRGIYNILGNAIEVDGIKQNGEAEFTIVGYNFTKNIDSITLTGQTNTITIPSEDINFEDVTSIKARISGDNAVTLSQVNGAEYFTVNVHFAEDAPGVIYTSPVLIIVGDKGKPQVIDKYPYSSNSYTLFDENSLFPRNINGTTRYFLRVTFRDYDGTLVFNGSTALSSLRDISTVYAQGSGNSLIDTDFLTSVLNLNNASQQSYIDQYIFNRDRNRKEAYLYIPVKALRAQSTYSVTVAADLVRYSDVASGGGNDSITWGFTTMAVPYVKGISIGSLAEDYDVDQPLIITGDFFNSSTVRVFFNNVEAYRVTAASNSLKVYLPRGTNKLGPGLYNITVQNDTNHQRISYGSLSIIKAGKNIPDEESRLKDSTSKGDIVSSVRVSEDTILLKSKYNDYSYVELNLDQLMGEEVLVRKIKIEGGRGHRIGELDTKSKWCDINVYELGTSTYGSGDITLSVGRVEPALAQTLKSKLKGRAVKSEFIQVTGDNLGFDKVGLAIPFRNSDGSNLKVLRYDESTRNWSEPSFHVDNVNMRVEVESYRPGIFAVVE